MMHTVRMGGTSAASVFLLVALVHAAAPAVCAAQRLAPPRFGAVRAPVRAPVRASVRAEAMRERAAPADSAASGSAFVPMLLAATAGSGVGLLAGFALGSALHWGGGDDPGLTGAVLGAGVGSAAGSAFLARAVHRGHGMTHGPDVTMGIGLLGSLAGIGGLALAHDMGAQDERVFLGYMVAQGATVATLITLTWR